MSGQLRIRAPEAHQESTQANTPEPARIVVVQPLFLPINIAKQFDDVLKKIGQQPSASATTRKKAS